jgi:alpha-tubulin suppressor-like RCC1 family protein
MVVEKGVVAISAGGNHSLFVKDDGSVWGMGSNYDGQLGLDKNSDNNWPIRIIESEAKCVEASRNNSSFIVMKDGSLFGFGKDDHGQLGTGRTITNYLPVLVSERIKE